MVENALDHYPGADEARLPAPYTRARLDHRLGGHGRGRHQILRTDVPDHAVGRFGDRASSTNLFWAGTHEWAPLA
jgi:hypothetical protein